MPTTWKDRLVGGIIATAALVVFGGGGAASAIPEPAPSPAPMTSGYDRPCELTRVGDQLVRCDDLTGTGAPAPSWVPEQ